MSKKLTKNIVDNIEYINKGQEFYWDTELKGFGLRVTPTRKTYIVQSRANGRTVRKTIGTHGVFTPEEARREAKIQLGLLSKGVDVNKESKKKDRLKTTLNQAFKDYKKMKNLAENTLSKYEAALRTTFEDWADKPIIRIDRDMIEARFKEVSLRTKAIANADFRFLRALINFAMEKYTINGMPLVPSNPCNRLGALNMWNRIERRDTYITPNNLFKFLIGLKTSSDDRDLIATSKNQCLFILFTGCREQEAARLKWQDIDFEEKTVTFIITKNHKKHILPIGYWLLEHLKSLSEGKNKDEYIFPANNKEGHLKHHRKAIREISKNSKVDFCLHDIRRTFASIVNHHLGQSFTPYTIKRLLNHSQNDVTAGYIQFGVDDLREPIQLIEDFILLNGNVKHERKDKNMKNIIETIDIRDESDGINLFFTKTYLLKDGKYFDTLNDEKQLNPLTREEMIEQAKKDNLDFINIEN